MRSRTAFRAATEGGLRRGDEVMGHGCGCGCGWWCGASCGGWGSADPGWRSSPLGGPVSAAVETRFAAKKILKLGALHVVVNCVRRRVLEKFEYIIHVLPAGLLLEFSQHAQPVRAQHLHGQYLLLTEVSAGKLATCYSRIASVSNRIGRRCLRGGCSHRGGSGREVTANLRGVSAM